MREGRGGKDGESMTYKGKVRRYESREKRRVREWRGIKDEKSQCIRRRLNLKKKRRKG